MARIRTIKPEFFNSADICGLTPLARLFYVSMWCEADREGRLVWKPQTFKLRYFPGDQFNIESVCDEVTNAGLIVLYEVDGVAYGEIPKFSQHQVINNREAESVIPENPRVKDASARVKAEGRKEGREGKERKEGRNSAAEPRFDPRACLLEHAVDANVADDFLSLRKQKRAPLSLTAIDGLRNEAYKACVTLNEALSICCKRGWQGFEAGWIEKERAKGGSNGNDQASLIEAFTGTRPREPAVFVGSAERVD